MQLVKVYRDHKINIFFFLTLTVFNKAWCFEGIYYFWWNTHWMFTFNRRNVELFYLGMFVSTLHLSNTVPAFDSKERYFRQGNRIRTASGIKQLWKKSSEWKQRVQRIVEECRTIDQPDRNNKNGPHGPTTTIQRYR